MIDRKKRTKDENSGTQQWLPKFQYVIRMKLHTYDEYGDWFSFHIILYKRNGLVLNIQNKKNYNCPAMPYNLNSTHRILASHRF